MITICPNLAIPQVKKEFEQLVDAIGEDNAYLVWSENRGNPITKTPKGKESKLFNTILSVADNLTDAIRLKSQIYYANFKRWYGDWKTEPSLNKDLLYTNKKGEQKSVFNYGTYISDSQYDSISFTQNKLKVEKGDRITYKIYQDNINIGFISLTKNSEREYQVIQSKLKPEYQRKGFGTITYLKLAKQLEKKGAYLASDDLSLMNEGSVPLWQRFTAMGIAEYVRPFNYSNRDKNISGYYRFTNSSIRNERFYHGLPEGKFLNREEAIAYTKRLIPNVTRSNLQFLDKLLFQERFNNDYGVFVDGKIILAETEAGVKEKVLRHEIFHKIYNDYLSEYERQQLRESFEKNIGKTPIDTLQIEEYFAKGFESYKKDKRTIKGILKDLIEKVLSFIGFINDNNKFVKELYSRIDSGSFLTIEEQEQRIKELKTYIIENFDTVENFKRVRNYLLTKINDIQNSKPVTREELRTFELPKHLAELTIDMQNLSVNGNQQEKEQANYVISLIKYMSNKNKYDILIRSIYPNWNFKGNGKVFEYDEITEKTLEELSGVNEYQQNDDTVDQSSKTSAVIKDFFSGMEHQGIRLNPKFLYFKSLMLFKNITGENIREQLEERMRDEPHTSSMQVLIEKLLTLIEEVENFSINRNGELIAISRKIKFIDENTIIYSKNGNDVNEKFPSSRGVSTIKRNISKNKSQTTESFINSISKITGYPVETINNSFFYFQKANTLAELISHFSSQSEKEFFIAEEKRVPSRGFGYSYHGIASNDSGTVYKRELRTALSNYFDITQFMKNDKLHGFNVNSYFRAKTPDSLLRDLKSNNVNVKKEAIKKLLSLIKLEKFHENIDSYANELEINTLAYSLSQFLEIRIKALGTKKTTKKSNKETYESDEDLREIANYNSSVVSGISLYNTIEDILEQENGTLNLFRNVLNASSNYLRPTSVNNMNNDKVFLFNNSSSGKSILDTLAANWSKKRNIPEHLKTNFYKYNPFSEGGSIFKVITHDGLKSSFRNIGYKNESDNQWLSRVFNYAFSSPISEQPNTKTSTLLKYYNYTYTPSNRPTIMGVQINLLKQEGINSHLKNAILQFKQRPKDSIFKGYNRNSTINFEIINQVIPNFSVEKLEKMTTQEINSLVTKLDIELNKKADKALEYFKKSGFKFDADINKTLQNLYSRGYISKPEQLPAQTKWENGKSIPNENFDYNNLREAFRIFYKNNYLNSYFINQLVVGDYAYFKNSLDIIKRLQGVFAPGKKAYINPNLGLKKKFKAVIVSDEKFESSDIKEFLSEFIEDKNELDKLLNFFPKNYESTDGQGFMLPERRDALEVGVGQSYKLGNILKPAHYEIRVINGSPVPVMFKYSSIVLTDELVDAFPGLQKVRENMRKVEAEELVFKSGTKVGAPSELNDIKKAFNEDVIFSNVTELSNNYYRLQLNPAHEVDGTVANPTQLAYFLQILNKNTANADMLYKALSKLINNGLNTFKDKTNTIANTTTLLKTLTKGSGTERVNELLEAGLSLDFPAITQKIISSLSSKLSKDTVGSRLKGSKLVLQSDIGIYKSSNSMEGLPEERKKTLKEGERLRYVKEGNRMYAEVMLPSDFKVYIKQGDFLLHSDMLGFRIPSSELHSAVPLKVVGFYNSSNLGMDNVIIAPRELVPLHGSDFDVDALYIIRREYATMEYREYSPERFDLTSKREALTKLIEEKLKSEEFAITNIEQYELEEEFNNSNYKQDQLDKRGDNYNSDFAKIGWAKQNKENQYIWYEGNWERFIPEFNEIEKLNNQIKETKGEVLFAKNQPIGYEKKNGMWSFNPDFENKILELDNKDLEEAFYKNMVLDSFLEAVGAERNFDRMFSPISMELFSDETNPNSVFSYIKNQLGVTDVFVDSADASDLLDSLRIFNSSMEGAKLTGIFANLVKVFSYMSRASINNTPSQLNKKSKVVINGKRLKGLKDEVTIWQTLDSLLNAAIDNVKEQILPSLNITGKNVNLFATLLGMGVDIKTLTALNLSPLMRIVSTMDGRNLVKNIQTIKSELFKEYPSKDSENYKIEIEKNSLENFIKDYNGLDYNIETLKNFLSKNPQYTSDISSIINLVEEMDPVVKEIGIMSNIISVIKGFPARQFEIEELYNKFKQLDINEENNTIEKDSNNFDISNLLKNNPHLHSAFKGLSYLRDLFRNQIKIYSSEIDDFISSLEIPTFEFGKKEMNKHLVKQEFVKFVFSSFEDFSNEKEIENKKGMILTGVDAWNEKFINKFNLLKGNYINNSFIDSLSINFIPNKGYIITANNTNLEYEEIVERKEDFKKLPKDLQEGFVKYAAVNYGLSFGASNYSLVIPEELIKELDTKLNKQLEIYSKPGNEYLLEQIKDLFQVQLYLNHADSFSPIREDSSGSGITENGEIYSLSFENNGTQNFSTFIVKEYPVVRVDQFDPTEVIYTGERERSVYKIINSPDDPIVYYTIVGSQNKTSSYSADLTAEPYNIEDKFRSDMLHIKVSHISPSIKTTLSEKQANILNEQLEKVSKDKLDERDYILVRASSYSDKMRLKDETYSIKIPKDKTFDSNTVYTLEKATQKQKDTLPIKIQSSVTGVVKKPKSKQVNALNGQSETFNQKRNQVRDTGKAIEVSLNSIIDSLIAENKHAHFTNLLKHFRDNILGKDAFKNGKVFFVSQEKMKELGYKESVGGFAVGNLIYINVDHQRLNMDHTFIHELTHYFTMELLADYNDGKLTEPQRLAKANLTRLYQSILSQYNSLSEEQKNELPYAIKYVFDEKTRDINEFVAQALSSYEFQSYLNSFKVKRRDKKTVLQTLMDLIKNLLNISSVSKTSALTVTFDEIMVLAKDYVNLNDLSTDYARKSNGLIEPLALKMNPFTSHKVTMSDIKSQSSIIELSEKDDTRYKNTTTGKLYKRITDINEGLAALVTGIKTNFKFKTIGEASAYNYWDKYKIDPEIELSTDVMNGSKINKEDYIAAKNASIEDAKIKGTLLHKVIDAAIKINKGENVDSLKKEIRDIIQEKGMTSFVTRYGWITKVDESGHPANLARLMENVGINTFSKGIMQEHIDELESELKVASDLLGFAGTVDLLAKSYDGKFTIVDWKTGSNFDTGSIANRLFQFGRQQNDILDTPRNRARLQVVLYAMMLKLNNPDMQFKSLHTYWMGNERQAKNGDPKSEIAVRDYLDMIDSFFQQDGIFDEATGKTYKEIHEEMLKMSPDIFKISEYNGVSTQVFVDKQEISKPENELLEYYRNKLNTIINSVPNKQYYTSNQRQQISELTYKILELEKNPNTQFTETGDISGTTRWLGNLDDTSNGYIKTYKKILDQDRQKAMDEYYIKQRRFNRLLRPILEDYLGKKGMLTTDRAFFGALNNINTEKFWGKFYKTYERDGISYKGLVIEGTSEWNKLSSDEQRLLKYVQSEFKSVFQGEGNIWDRPAVTASEAYYKGMTVGQLYNFTKKSKFEYETFNETFLPTIPPTSEEIRERYGIFSKENFNFLKSKSITRFYEDNYEGWTDDTEALPFKYLGSTYIRNSGHHSLNLEKIFDRFMMNTINKKHLDHTYSIGKGLQIYLQMKSGDNQDMYRNTIDMLDDKLMLDILNRKKDFKFFRKSVRIGSRKDKQGNEYVEYLDINQLLRSLKSFISAPVMWLKPIQGTRNNIFIGMLNVKEAVKGSIADTGLFGIDGDEVDFTAKDLAFAYKEWANMQKDFLMQRHRQNKMWLLLRKFRYLPDNYDWATTSSDLLSQKNKIIDQSTLYMFHTLPEEWHAGMIMVAQLNRMKNQKTGKSIYDSYKVIEEGERDTNNNLISQTDYHRKEFSVVWDGGVRGVIQTATNEYKEITELDSQEINKLKRVYTNMHGGYRREERTAMEAYILGELFLQFKKYLPAVLKNAFRSKGTDSSLGYYKFTGKKENGEDVMEWIERMNEGRWRLLYRVFATYATLRTFDYSELSSQQKLQLLDAAITLSTWFGMVVAWGQYFDDTEDENSWKKISKFVLDNYSQQYNPYDIGRNLFQVPTTLSKSFKGVINLADLSIASGQYLIGDTDNALTQRGDLRGLTEVKRTTPIVASFYDLIKFIEGDKEMEAALLR